MISRMHSFLTRTSPPFIPLRIHPILLCTLSIIMGILWATYSFNFSLICIFLVAASSLCIYTCASGTCASDTRVGDATTLKSTRWRSACWLACCLALFSYSAYTTHMTIKKHIQTLHELARKPIDVTGNITLIDQHHHAFYRYVMLLKTPEFTLQLFADQKGNIKTGDTICLKNLTIKAAQGEYQKYLIKEGILASVFLTNPTYEIVHRPAWSYLRALQETKDRLYYSIKRKLSKVTSHLYLSLFLGKKSKDTTQSYIASKFGYWGIIHYLARSGLHVALIVFLWAYLLRFIPVGFFLKQIILALLIIMYNLLTFTSISFERAYITFLLYKLCNFQQAPIHTLHIVTLTTGLFLLINPFQLFYLDFQLSFGLTFALALFNELNQQAKIFRYKTIA